MIEAETCGKNPLLPGSKKSAGSVYRITEDPAFSHFCPAEGGLLSRECAEMLRGAFERARLDKKDNGET